MAATKAATVRVFTIEVFCSDCETPVVSPHNGSEYLTLEDARKLGASVTCSGCGAKLSIPAKWRK